MIKELAKQIEDIALKLEEQKGPEVGVPWFERQMDWLGWLKDALKERDEGSREMAMEELTEGFKYANTLINRGV